MFLKELESLKTKKRRVSTCRFFPLQHRYFRLYRGLKGDPEAIFREEIEDVKIWVSWVESIICPMGGQIAPAFSRKPVLSLLSRPSYTVSWANFGIVDIFDNCTSIHIISPGYLIN